jgi:hypothetical protein
LAKAERNELLVFAQKEPGMIDGSVVMRLLGLLDYDDDERAIAANAALAPEPLQTQMLRSLPCDDEANVALISRWERMDALARSILLGALMVEQRRRGCELLLACEVGQVLGGAHPRFAVSH